MFPVRVVVESVADGQCVSCSTGGGPVVTDSYAIVSGETPMSGLVDTVLAALGLHHLCAGAKGMIQVKNWKPLKFEQVADDLQMTVDHLLKELSNHITLRITTKQVNLEDSKNKESFLWEMKHNLLSAALNRSPQILSSIRNDALKNFVYCVLSGNLSSSGASPDQLEAFNNWLEDLPRLCPLPDSGMFQQTRQPSSPQSLRLKSISANFHLLLELPKLQMWLKENPTPSCQTLLQYMHLLNTSNYRRQHRKVSYQQIANWFNNARQMQTPATSVASSENGLPTPISSDNNAELDSAEPAEASESPTGISQEFCKEPNSFTESTTPTSSLTVDDAFDSAPIKVETGSVEGERDDADMAISVESVDGDSWSLEPSSPGLAHGATSNDSTAAFPIPLPTSPPSMNRFNRLLLDPITELPFLENWFEKNPHPTWLQIQLMTKELNAGSQRQAGVAITTHNVKIWFKNRRAKCKRLMVRRGIQL